MSRRVRRTAKRCPDTTSLEIGTPFPSGPGTRGARTRGLRVGDAAGSLGLVALVAGELVGRRRCRLTWPVLGPGDSSRRGGVRISCGREGGVEGRAGANGELAHLGDDAGSVPSLSGVVAFLLNHVGVGLE